MRDEDDRAIRQTIAHRVGEPFGTLVLALAVTVIEVALIVSVMLGGGSGKPHAFAIVLLVSALVALVPPLFFGGLWHDWLYKGISLLLIDCP